VIVKGDEDDVVNTLGLELVEVVQVGLGVIVLTSRREGTGDSGDDDLLVLELCV